MVITCKDVEANGHIWFIGAMYFPKILGGLGDFFFNRQTKQYIREKKKPYG